MTRKRRGTGGAARKGGASPQAVDLVTVSQATRAGNLYGWKAGVHLPVDAQSYGLWLESLPDREPTTILEAAKDPKSIAHVLFNWSDKEAARQHRLTTVRRLNSCLTIELIVESRDKPQVFTVKAFVKGGRDEPYEPMAHVLSDATKRDYLLRKCLKELATLRREYASLSELVVVFAAIDTAQETVATPRRKRA